MLLEVLVGITSFGLSSIRIYRVLFIKFVLELNLILLRGSSLLLYSLSSHIVISFITQDLLLSSFRSYSIIHIALQYLKNVSFLSFSFLLIVSLSKQRIAHDSRLSVDPSIIKIVLILFLLIIIYQIALFILLHDHLIIDILKHIILVSSEIIVSSIPSS